jgi:hypothetical protein
MEAISSSETSADFQRTTRPYISEDRILHKHCYENLKSYTVTVYTYVINFNKFMY